MSVDAKTMEGSEKLVLNVRGRHFLVDVATLTKYPEATIHKIAQQSTEGDIYVNRNPDLVSDILKYYSHGELHLPTGYCRILLKQELEFWGLSLNDVSSCCKAKVAQGVAVPNYSSGETWRHKAFAAYTSADTALGKVVCILSVILHVAFWLTFLSRRSSYYEKQFEYDSPYDGDSISEDNPDTDEIRLIVANARKMADMVLVVLLTVWNVFWIVVCPDRRQHYVTEKHMTYSIIVALQWIPVCLLLADNRGYPSVVYYFIYLISLARVITFVPLIKKWRFGRTVLTALSTSVREILFILDLIFLLSLMFGYLAYVADYKYSHSQFKSFGNGLWWALVTITTVGYGDITPVGSLGKAVAILCGYSGVICMGLMLAVIRQNFRSLSQEEDDREHLGQIDANENELSEYPHHPQTVTVLCNGIEVVVNAEQGGRNRRITQASAENSEITSSFSTFQHILDYLNTGFLHLPETCSKRLDNDLISFGISDAEVATCCRRKVSATPLVSKTVGSSMQRKLWEIYTFEKINIPSVVTHILLWICYIVYLIPILLKTLPEFKHYKIVNSTVGYQSIEEDDYAESNFSDPLNALDLGVLVILTIWFIVVIAICPDRHKVFFTERQFIYPLAVFVQWLPSAIKLSRVELRLLCGLIEISRAILFFSLYTRWRYARLVLQTLRRSLGMVWLLFCMICLLGSVFAIEILIAESRSEDSHFGSFSDGMWWAMVTLLTVGYGDYRPIGMLGKISGIICCMFGLLCLALPIPELLRNAKLVYEENKRQTDSAKKPDAQKHSPAVDDESAAV